VGSSWQQAGLYENASIKMMMMIIMLMVQDQGGNA
jgi:hypothetical protein